MSKTVTDLSPQLQGIVGEYVALVQALAGERLKAVTLFGPAAEGTAPESGALLQSVLVLEGLDLTFVRELAAQGAMLGRLGLQAPLLMTPAYIEASRDVFPIELLDIQRRHVQVFGPDLFDTLTFRKEHVRLQLERELKRALIQIRQGLLSAAGREGADAELYWAAAEQALQLLRALVWLHGQEVPLQAPAVVAAAESCCALKLPGLVPALEGQVGRGTDELDALYSDLLTLSRYVDGMTA